MGSMALKPALVVLIFSLLAASGFSRGPPGGLSGGPGFGKPPGFGKGGSGGSGRAGLGTPVGAVIARMNGSNVVDVGGTVTGDVNATGVVVLAVFLNGTSDYNVRYGASVHVTDPGTPTGITISSGGSVQLDFGSDAAWANLTWNGTRYYGHPRRHLLSFSLSHGRLARSFPHGPPPIPTDYFGFFCPSKSNVTGFTYGFSGVWYGVSGITTAGGQTVKEVVDGMFASPADYSALVTTDTYSSGALAGAFANRTAPTDDDYWRRGH